MEEMQKILEDGAPFARLAGKILGLWPMRRQIDDQSIAAADANAYENITTALANVIGDRIEANPHDPVMLEALISCGGRTNLKSLVRILQLVVPRLSGDARPDLISDDWLANLKDKARTCSDPDMADLWASLLGGEANAPGSYSKKTVNVVADLEPDDARLFRNLSMFRIVPTEVEYNPASGEIIGVGSHEKPRLVVLDNRHIIYTDAGVNFTSLTRLEWLGLVVNHATGYQMTAETPGVRAWLLGNELLYAVPDSKSITMGNCQFTPAGEELSKLCVPLTPPKGFIDYVARAWGDKGIRVARSLSEALAIEQQAQLS